AVAASALLAWFALISRPAPVPMLCAPDDAPSAYVEPAFGDLRVEEGPAGPLSLRAHRVTVTIDDWVARTEVEEIFFNDSIRKLECPAHRVDEARPDARSARVELRVRNARPAADFQLRVELEMEELEAVSHRPAGEDGFLGIAIAPKARAEGGAAGDHVFIV